MKTLVRWTAKDFVMICALTSLVISLTACNNPVTSAPINFSAEEENGIIGGELVQDQDPISRSTVALVIQTPQGPQLCSGAIIGEMEVLTAAHCLSKPYFSIHIVFSTDLNEVYSEQSQSKTRRAVLVKTPETWSRNFLFNRLPGVHEEDVGDLALLKLNKKIPEGSSIVPMLSEESFINSNSELIVAGYGAIDDRGTQNPKLRKVSLKAYSQYGRTEFSVDQSNGKGIALGDSGGPAYMEVDGQYYLAGVVSRKTQDNRFSVFTSVASYNTQISDSEGIVVAQAPQYKKPKILVVLNGYGAHYWVR